MSTDQQLQLVCPNCGAINRIDYSRLGEGPTCGSCKQALFTGAPTAVDAAGLHRFIENNQMPLVVDFWAPWCGPCVAMKPHFAAAAQQMEPKMRFLTLNTDDNPACVDEFHIQAFPTILVLFGGQVIGTKVGGMSAGQIQQFALGSFMQFMQAQ
jgi:thioredoxin 2